MTDNSTLEVAKPPWCKGTFTARCMDVDPARSNCEDFYTFKERGGPMSSMDFYPFQCKKPPDDTIPGCVNDQNFMGQLTGECRVPVPCCRWTCKQPDSEMDRKDPKDPLFWTLQVPISPVHIVATRRLTDRGDVWLDSAVAVRDAHAMCMEKVTCKWADEATGRALKWLDRAPHVVDNVTASRARLGNQETFNKKGRCPLLVQKHWQ